MARSRENQALYDAIRNCYNPKRAQFSQYGAIGIKVCQQWRDSFKQFLADMGPAPVDRPWLGRLDVRDDYDPGNCEWTNRAEQMNRRAFCRKVTLQGQVMTAAQASRMPGQPTRNGVLKRAANGMLTARPVSSRLLPKSKWIEYAGEKLPIYEWARRQGIALATLQMRLKRGWSIDQALNPELRQGRKLPENLALAPIGQPAAMAIHAANR